MATRLAVVLAGVLLAGRAVAHELPCDDGLDNDRDGAADCLDPDCAFFPGCEESDCTNGVDDNGNGYVDCDDPSCYSYPGCINLEDCGNRVDDDGDTLVDCDDPGCLLNARCATEICGNGVDDEFDGLVDCDDPDCFGVPPCIPEDCADRIDDDGDGLVDCADDDCLGAPACAGLAVNRSVSLTPAGAVPAVRLAFCSTGPPLHLCPELRVAGALDGMTLPGEASPVGRDVVWFYEHSDAVDTMKVSRADAELVFHAN